MPQRIDKRLVDLGFGSLSLKSYHGGSYQLLLTKPETHHPGDNFRQIGLAVSQNLVRENFVVVQRNLQHEAVSVGDGWGGALYCFEDKVSLETALRAAIQKYDQLGVPTAVEAQIRWKERD